MGANFGLDAQWQRFINGQMTPEEAASFRDAIEKNPDLLDDAAKAYLEAHPLLMNPALGITLPLPPSADSGANTPLPPLSDDAKPVGDAEETVPWSGTGGLDQLGQAMSQKLGDPPATPASGQPQLQVPAAPPPEQRSMAQEGGGEAPPQEQPAPSEDDSVQFTVPASGQEMVVTVDDQASPVSPPSDVPVSMPGTASGSAAPTGQLAPDQYQGLPPLPDPEAPAQEPAPEPFPQLLPGSFQPTAPVRDWSLPGLWNRGTTWIFDHYGVFGCLGISIVTILFLGTCGVVTYQHTLGASKSVASTSSGGTHTGTAGNGPTTTGSTTTGSSTTGASNPTLGQTPTVLASGAVSGALMFQGGTCPTSPGTAFGTVAGQSFQLAFGPNGGLDFFKGGSSQAFMGTNAYSVDTSGTAPTITFHAALANSLGTLAINGTTSCPAANLR